MVFIYRTKNVFTYEDLYLLNYILFIFVEKREFYFDYVV